jgi:hypothetical protein
VAPRRSTRIGSTTFRTVVSRVTISSEMHSTARASHRRLPGSPGPAPVAAAGVPMTLVMAAARCGPWPCHAAHRRWTR